MPPRAPRPEPDAAAKPRRRYASRMAPSERREQVIDAALSVIVQQGYEGVSIEAIARTDGVTRPVIYDHFRNLGALLEALIEREESYALQQLARVVPADPGATDPIDVLAGGVRRFRDAVATRPDTWRIILLPLDGTPAIVRDHVETNRARTVQRLHDLVRWAIARDALPSGLDIELTARSIQSLGEEAGRMVLTDADRYSPARYETFVGSVMSSLAATTRAATG
ncbi:MAG: TetR/AcrR family transcriptional regulator [Solirubrobacteraceae bacterium]